MELGAVESNHISRGLINLAQGPDKRVIRLTGCTINGHRFHTKDRDTCRKSQNSGVLVQAEHQGKVIDFYGVLIDIIELSYIGGNTVLIFKCDWWDIGNKRKINVDEFEIISVNVTKTWYKDQPFVLATQARQVYYVTDIKLGKDWRIVQLTQPRNIYDVCLPPDVLQPDAEPYQEEEWSTHNNCLETENYDFPLLNRGDNDNILINVDVEGFPNIDANHDNHVDDVV